MQLQIVERDGKRTWHFLMSDVDVMTNAAYLTTLAVYRKLSNLPQDAIIPLVSLAMRGIPTMTEKDCEDLQCEFIRLFISECNRLNIDLEKIAHDNLKEEG